MNANELFVSIILPTYNREGTIGRAVKSIINQTYKKFELIIVDDGSEDHTRDVIESFQDSRIRYIKSDKRRGANAARNTGIRNSMYEIIAFQDSDDYWMSDKLQKQIDILCLDKTVDAVFTNCKYCGLDGSDFLIITRKQQWINENLKVMLAMGNVIGTPALIVKKSCIENAGMFDEGLQRFQDWELNLRLVQNYKINYIDEPLTVLYETEGNISSSRERGIIAMAMIIKKHKDFLEQNGVLEKYLCHILSDAAEHGILGAVHEVIGTSLMYEGIRSMACQSDREKKRFLFAANLLLRGERCRIINDFFEPYSRKSVIIFGGGEVEKFIIDLLDDKNIDRIRFIINKLPLNIKDINVYIVDELKEKDFDSAECILVTEMKEYEQIAEMLRKIGVKSRIVGLDEIIGK